MSDQLFNSLVGRVVQVYKGGPESQVGKLVSVKDDYLTVQTEKGEMIYYTAEHIKSIVEDSQARFRLILNNNLTVNSDDPEAPNVHELIQKLIGEKVRINRGGPESRIGKLLAVKGNFIMVYTESDGLLFYTTKHIKSLSPVVENNEETVTSNDVVQEEASIDEKNEENKIENLLSIFKEVEADNFNDFLSNLKYTWVKINRGGPESIEGLLVDNTDKFFVLVVNQDVLRFPIEHVKSLSFGLPQNNQQKENKEDEKREDNNKKDSKKEGKKDKEKNKKDKNKEEKGNKNKKNKD